MKVFGGADVLPVTSRLSGRPTVGQQNWQTALEVLREGRLHRDWRPTWEARRAAPFTSIPEPGKCCCAGLHIDSRSRPCSRMNVGDTGENIEHEQTRKFAF